MTETRAHRDTGPAGPGQSPFPAELVMLTGLYIRIFRERRRYASARFRFSIASSISAVVL